LFRGDRTLREVYDAREKHRNDNGGIPASAGMTHKEAEVIMQKS